MFTHGNQEPKQAKLDLSAKCNDTTFLKVTLNKTHVKFISTEWITNNGRAAGSILAKQLLGTREGLQGSTNLTIEEEFLPVFDTLLLWLSSKDDDEYLLSELVSEETAPLLIGLAQYFGIEKLEETIRSSVEEEEEAKRANEEAEKMKKTSEEPAAITRMISSMFGMLKLNNNNNNNNNSNSCALCGMQIRMSTTKNDAASQNFYQQGNQRCCWDCHRGRYYESDLYYDGLGDDDDDDDDNNFTRCDNSHGFYCDSDGNYRRAY